MHIFKARSLTLIFSIICVCRQFFVDNTINVSYIDNLQCGTEWTILDISLQDVSFYVNDNVGETKLSF